MHEQMDRIPDDLLRALEADESQELDVIVQNHQDHHFRALALLATSPRLGNPEYRQRALYALGRWGNPAVVPDIVAFLPEFNEMERVAAVEALGRLGTELGMRAIADRSNDPSPQVRKFVVQALARMSGTESQRVLQRMAEKDTVSWIRELARRRLPGTSRPDTR